MKFTKEMLEKAKSAEILEVCDKKYGNFYYKVTGGLYKMEQELFD